ncbi:MAG: hypothetical protein RBS80_08930 [Thermoguttaceae bacterium]|jgi:hypothetical protein|nr:hypothetical protein [Thermoguttaceae bacterium]
MLTSPRLTGFLPQGRPAPVWIGLAAAALAGLLLSGCGDGRPRRVRVSGRVTIDGQPLSSGFVRLVPDNARPSVGRIGEDGSFTLTTFAREDGSVPGKHRVAVVAYDESTPAQLRWLVPQKYSQPGTSELTVDISGPTDSLEIALTWGQESPQRAVERHDTRGDVDPAAMVQ